VRCRITQGALQRLVLDAGVGWSPAGSEQAFVKLKPRVEAIASRKFDADYVARNRFLLIGPEDLDKAWDSR
jgi:hypothetical protein